MTKYEVGKDVLSFCNKCKLALMHTLLSLRETGACYKVMCNTCKNTHVYKDPKKATAAKKTRSTKRKKALAEQAEKTEIWGNAVNDKNQEAMKYTISSTFEKDDLINHKQFGKGVVEKVLDDSKIQVIFENDIKILICNQKV